MKNSARNFRDIPDGTAFRLTVLLLIICVPVLCLLASSTAFAAQPANPITQTITVSGTETWNSDILLSGSGRLVVTGNLTIEGAVIRFSDLSGDSPMITVSGNEAVLALRGSSRIDMSGNNTKKAMLVEKQGTAVLENTEVSGLTKCEPYTGPGLGYFVIDRGTLKLVNSVFKNNQFEHYIGAFAMIYASDSTVEIEDSKISGNEISESTSENAFLYLIKSNLQIIGNTVFENNTVARPVTSKESEVQIGDNVQFINNHSWYEGGAIFARDSQIIIEKAVFTKNKANYFGGALAVYDTTLVINGTRFENNSSYQKEGLGKGGGIFLSRGDLTANDTVFNGNSVIGAGGGIYTENAKVTIGRNNQFTGNETAIGSQSGFHYEGGSILVLNSELGIEDNNQFTGNIAAYHGGVVKVINSNVTIGNDNLFQQNEAPGGGGSVIDMDAVKTDDPSSDYTLSIGNRNKFIDNHGDDGAIAVYYAILKIENENEFIGNTGFGGAITIYGTPTTIGDNNLFERNSAVEIMGVGGAIQNRNADMVIGDGNIFKNNESHGNGGAIYIERGKLTIGNSFFIGNRNIYGNGGAISVIVPSDYSEGSLVINGGVFEDNRAYQNGGAIHVFGWNDLSVSIKDAAFSDNTSGMNGSAVYFGQIPTYSYDDCRNLGIITAHISNCKFIENSIISTRDDLDYSRIFGGTVANGCNTELTLSRLALSENSGNVLGGGIISMTGSELYIKPRNGAALFGNDYGFSSLPTQDIFLTDAAIPHQIPEKMFNGGYHRWQVEEGIPFTNWKQEPVTGSVWSADPTKTGFTDPSTTLQGNHTDAAHDYMIGAGILNYGKLTIGEDAAAFEITKIWEDEGAAEIVRPGLEDLLNSLVFIANDEPLEIGKFTLDEQVSEAETDVYYFSGSTDTNVTLIVRDTHDDRLGISVDGLPLTDETGTITYRVAEQTNEYYDAEISGDAAGGFTIRNTWNGKLPPTPTPIPTPTPEPDQGIPFFRLIEQLDTLPQTGI